MPSSHIFTRREIKHFRIPPCQATALIYFGDQIRGLHKRTKWQWINRMMWSPMTAIGFDWERVQRPRCLRYDQRELVMMLCIWGKSNGDACHYFVCEIDRKTPLPRYTMMHSWISWHRDKRRLRTNVAFDWSEDPIEDEQDQRYLDFLVNAVPIREADTDRINRSTLRLLTNVLKRHHRGFLSALSRHTADGSPSKTPQTFRVARICVYQS